MSKCGKNISDTLGCASCTTILFLPHFDVICDLLVNRRMATWNLFVKQTTAFKDVIFSSDAAEVLRANRRLFEQNVQRAMRGGYVGSVYFERCLK